MSRPETVSEANRRAQLRCLAALDQLGKALDGYQLSEIGDVADARLGVLLKCYGRAAYLADRSRRLAEKVSPSRDQQA